MLPYLFALTFALGPAMPAATAETQFWGNDDEEYFRWRGRVDGVDDIIIQGRDVRIEHVAAKPIQNQDHRFSAPLPSAEIPIRLEVIKGRGDVRILEQPTRRNGYTAVVRVDDGEQGGDADYEFELSWSREDWEDNDLYSATFTWRGRVDIACEIHIRGRSHEVEDEGGQGTQERSARFTDALPSEDVPVSVKKEDGRGRVELVQSPNAGNDYTAVVRIEDDKGGADNYEVVLRWPKR